MIAAARKFAKSWVAAVLIGLLIISFAVFQTQDALQGNFSNDVVTVGSRKVSPDDYKREFDNLRKNAEQQMGQPVTQEMAVANGLDNRVLSEIATREAFSEMLQKAGIRPSDKLLAAEIQKIPAFFDQVTGRFDKNLFAQRLGENGLTPQRFETIVRDQIAETHAVSAIANGLRVPRAYSALGAIYETEARDVGYFSLAPNSVAPPAPPTDAQLTAFMKENEASLTRPETRVLTIVSFNPGLAGANLAIDEKEVQKRFEFRKDTMSKPETRTVVQIPAKDAATAQAIVARLNKGEAPAAIAKSLGVDAITYADKPKTAIADARVGEAAFGLKQGEVAAVQGALGQAVVQVSKVTPGEQITLAQVRPQIEAELRKDAAAEKVYALSQAYDDAHADGASLPEAAKKAGVPTFTIGPVGAQGQGPNGQPVPGLSPKMLEAAFSLPAGGESEVQEVGDGSYFAVRVERIVPKSLPPLAEVKPQLTQVWMMRELVKALQAKADGLAARLRKGESLEAVAASAGARVTRVTSIDRQNAGQNQQLSRDALMKAFTGKSGDVFTAEDVRPGFVVAKIEAVRAPSGVQLARMTEDARPQMTMGLFREIGESARRVSRTEMKVKVYPDRARSALGLEPLVEKAGATGKAEKQK